MNSQDIQSAQNMPGPAIASHVELLNMQLRQEP